MNYKIKAIFTTENEAFSASPVLCAAGYRKEFLGYTQNANIQPESLVEDHKIDKNSVTVYTPNLNRAFKAKNILTRIGAISTQMKMPFSQNILNKEKTATFKNFVNQIQNNLLDYHQTNFSLELIDKMNSPKSKKISESKNIMLNKS